MINRLKEYIYLSINRIDITGIVDDDIFDSVCNGDSLGEWIK